MKQFILIVNGPMPGGKTSAVEAILSTTKKVFRVSPNKIKFLISDYNPERDRTLVHDTTFLVAEKMLEGGMSLLIEGGSVMQGNLNDLIKELGKKHGVKTTIVNIEAPLPVLRKRFDERIQANLVSGKKMSITTEEEFMKRYDAYLAIRDQAEKTFDSSLLGPGDIAKGIIAIL